ncbi:MAG: nucleoside hydrolase [Schumannella sp.]|nr:nucleoside hydrolase [Microbacteriaceae bacterium]
MADRTPVLIDCDTGIDDAMALLFMLAQDRYDVVGITSVFGNNTAAQCAINSLRVLELVGRTDIPVAVGAEQPLVGEVTYLATHVHGSDGLGDAGLPVDVTASVDARDAVQLIDDLSREHAGRLRILAVAPLTNLAHALEAIPDLTQRIHDVVIMGGAADAPGNQSPAAEANIIHDPEAAQAVLSADWGLTLVPLDVTMREVLEESDRTALFDAATPVTEFVARATDFYFGGYGSDVYARRASPAHDALAAAILTGDIVPTVFPEIDVTVDCTDGPGRGSTICDTRGRYRGFEGTAAGRVRVALQTDGGFPRVLVQTLVDYGSRLSR